MVLKGIELLLGPDTPVWLKVMVCLVFAGSLAAWWTEPYWHNLQKPDKDIRPRKARPF